MLQEHWKYDPFLAHKEENGDIYARGSQVQNNFYVAIFVIFAIHKSVLLCLNSKPLLLNKFISFVGHEMRWYSVSNLKDFRSQENS